MKTGGNLNPYAEQLSSALNNSTTLCTHTAAAAALIAVTGRDIGGVESDSCN